MTDALDLATSPWPDQPVVQCVFCFEWVTLDVDPQDRGAMVHDCDVCCRPLQITVQWSGDGQLNLNVEPAC